MPSDDEVCITCGWNVFIYSEMIPGGWFCEECGTPSAKTQELLDREEPGNWADELPAIADELEGIKYGTYRCDLKDK